MKIGVVKEIQKNESRVAITPKNVEQLAKIGFATDIETQAGLASGFSDDDYIKSGAKIVNKESAWLNDLVVKVLPPSLEETSLLKEGAALISLMSPHKNAEILQALANKRVDVMSMDCVPRISRAQKLDVLSSMANIAGYRAVIEAASEFSGFFGGQITAAGKINPAKVLVIGAGVAGLAAIGAAKSLGAIVRSFDTRLEVKEQIESMGAEFLVLNFNESGGSSDGYAKTMSPEFIEKEMELFAKQSKEVDIIITTALIPGKPAPKLITDEMIKTMKPGSIIIDMAAEQGGNCDNTVPGELIEKYGVKIIGYTDFASRMATQSSQLYGTNIFHLISELCKNQDNNWFKDNNWFINIEDEMIRGLTTVKDGKVIWPAPPIKISQTDIKASTAKPKEKIVQKKPSPLWKVFGILSFTLLLSIIGLYAPRLLPQFTLFTLACIIGFYVIWNVTPALHTPLMSVTNAISGIMLVGALVLMNSPNIITIILALIAIFIAAINIFGGFLVTHRMLDMFQKKDK